MTNTTKTTTPTLSQLVAAERVAEARYDANPSKHTLKAYRDACEATNVAYRALNASKVCT